MPRFETEGRRETRLPPRGIPEGHGSRVGLPGSVASRQPQTRPSPSDFLVKSGSKTRGSRSVRSRTHCPGLQSPRSQPADGRLPGSTRARASRRTRCCEGSFRPRCVLPALPGPLRASCGNPPRLPCPTTAFRAGTPRPHRRPRSGRARADSITPGVRSPKGRGRCAPLPRSARSSCRVERASPDPASTDADSPK